MTVLVCALIYLDISHFLCFGMRISTKVFLLSKGAFQNERGHDVTSPAIVLRNMRYSKLEISLLCQRWVMLEDLKSWRGVAREIRLVRTQTRVFKRRFSKNKRGVGRLNSPGLWQTVTRSNTHPWETVNHPFDGGLVREVKHHWCWRKQE